MNSEMFTPEEIIVKEKMKNEIKMIGITISEDILEDVFYKHFVLEGAWNEVLDKSLKKKLPADQLDKLKRLKLTVEDLTMNIASEPQNRTEVSAIRSSSLEERMIFEEDPVESHKEDMVASHKEDMVARHKERSVTSHKEIPLTSHKENLVASQKENPASNEEESALLLIQDLKREKTKVKSLFSTQNMPTPQDLEEIAKFGDKLTSAEQIYSPRQSEIKEISEKFVDQIVKFAESIAEVIKNQFSPQKSSAYIYAFAIIENPFKVLAYLTKIPKVSNSYQLQEIFWSAVEVVDSKVIDSKEAALNIISSFYPNGSKREYNEALTCHLKSLEKAKWIDKYVDHHSCQQFSSEIKNEIVECVEKFIKDIKKIDLNDERNKWIDEISAIQSKVNTLLPLKSLSENLENELTKFSKQVQDKKATFFANITKEFSMDRLKHMEPNSLNISKAITALEGLKRIEDCDRDDKYESANTALDKYLKGYFTNIMKCFQQLKTAIENVINPKNDLKDSLELSLDSIRKNSKIFAGYLDKLKLIKDKFSLLHEFIPEEEVDSSLSYLRKLRKSLAIEVERLCSQTHSIINFRSRLHTIEGLMELDGHIPSDDESFSQLYEKHSQSYEGQIQKIFNDAKLNLKNDKLKSVVVTMKELEHTSPQLFSKLKTDLENYINNLVKKIKEEAVSLSPSLPFDRSERIANGLSVLEEAKIQIPKEYLPYSFNKIVDCIISIEENMSNKVASNVTKKNQQEWIIQSVIRKANKLSGSDQQLELNGIEFVQFTPEITRAIEKRSGLLFLYLNDCGLKTLKGFPKLPELYSCELTDNKIAGSELRYLSHLAQLHSLSLGGNPISDFEYLEPLTELKNLTYLNLHDCPISRQKDYRKQIFAKFCGLQELDNMRKDIFEIDDEKYGKKKSSEGRKKLKKSSSENDLDDDRLGNYDNYSDEAIDFSGDDVDFPHDDYLD